MGIYWVLQNYQIDSNRSEKLVNAYELTRRALGLEDHNDPLTDKIAKRVVQIGRDVSISDAHEICRLTIKELFKEFGASGAKVPTSVLHKSLDSKR